MRTLVFYLLLGFGVAYGANGPFSDFYLPPTPAPVVWSVSNDIPNELWMYKVIPQNFSTAVVSNAMVIGDLNKSDQRPLPGKITARDPGTLHFRTKREDRWLTVQPSTGWIHFQAEPDMNVPIKNVPTDEDVIELAQKCLFQLGIDRRQVEKKPRFRTEGKRGKLDTNGAKLTEQVNSRGVFLVRVIDGIEFMGEEGLMLGCGTDAKITRFNLVWRNLVADKLCRICEKSEIASRIQAGKSTLVAQADPLKDLSNLREIIIEKIDVLYWSAAGGEHQNYIEPFAQLEAKVITDTNLTNSIHLRCPILSSTQH